MMVDLDQYQKKVIVLKLSSKGFVRLMISLNYYYLESAEKEFSGMIKSGRISATSLSSMLSKKFKQITGSKSSHEQLSQQSRLVSAKGSPLTTSSIGIDKSDDSSKYIFSEILVID